jgi:hypothetical protein
LKKVKNLWSIRLRRDKCWKRKSIGTLAFKIQKNTKRDRQWAQCNVETVERYHQFKAYAAATARNEDENRQIHKLRRKSVLFDMFQIVVDENMGIIKGLQMGKAHETPIDWEEVNTAWGIVVLLVETICKAQQYRSSQ